MAGPEKQGAAFYGSSDSHKVINPGCYGSGAGVRLGELWIEIQVGWGLRIPKSRWDQGLGSRGSIHAPQSQNPGWSRAPKSRLDPGRHWDLFPKSRRDQGSWTPNPSGIRDLGLQIQVGSEFQDPKSRFSGSRGSHPKIQVGSDLQDPKIQVG